MARSTRSKISALSAPGGRHTAVARAPASATLLPFARAVPPSLSITRAERAETAGWAAHQAFSAGGIWWVETHLTDEGTAWLGVVTPSSRGSRRDRSFAWLIERTIKGVELTRSMTWEKQVFRTVIEALAFIEAAEGSLCLVAKAVFAGVQGDPAPTRLHSGSPQAQHLVSSPPAHLSQEDEPSSAWLKAQD